MLLVTAWVVIVLTLGDVSLSNDLTSEERVSLVPTNWKVLYANSMARRIKPKLGVVSWMAVCLCWEYTSFWSSCLPTLVLAVGHRGGKSHGEAIEHVFAPKQGAPKKPEKAMSHGSSQFRGCVGPICMVLGLSLTGNDMSLFYLNLAPFSNKW